MEIKEVRKISKTVAEALDYFRIVPRVILIAYSYIMYDIIQWFMVLEAPSTEQASLIITTIGVAGAIIGLYQNSGKVWKKEDFDE